jgi:hypothetical protein
LLRVDQQAFGLGCFRPCAAERPSRIPRSVDEIGYLSIGNSYRIRHHSGLWHALNPPQTRRRNQSRNLAGEGRRRCPLDADDSPLGWGIFICPRLRTFFARR